MQRDIANVVSEFLPNENCHSYTTLSDGLVHHTYVLITEKQKYILQKINTTVFRDPVLITQNMAIVARHLAASKMYPLSIPELILSSTGSPLFRDDQDATWRCIKFIEHKSLTKSVDEDLAYVVGGAFGTFDDALSTLDPQALEITISNFHNPTFRLRQFSEAIKISELKLHAGAKGILQLIESHLYIADAFRKAKLPQKIAHNDAKPSNILFGEDGKPVAIIDLDTVMPGTPLFDFGDLVRSMANSVSEDVQASEELFFDSSIFHALKSGYLDAYTQIDDLEKRHLSTASAYLIFEQCVRFMTDYLRGSIYYRIDYPEHNFVRAQNQMALLQSFIGRNHL